MAFNYTRVFPQSNFVGFSIETGMLLGFAHWIWILYTYYSIKIRKIFYLTNVFEWSLSWVYLECLQILQYAEVFTPLAAEKNVAEIAEFLVVRHAHNYVGTAPPTHTYIYKHTRHMHCWLHNLMPEPRPPAHQPNRRSGGGCCLTRWHIFTFLLFSPWPRIPWISLVYPCSSCCCSSNQQSFVTFDSSHAHTHTQTYIHTPTSTRTCLTVTTVTCILHTFGRKSFITWLASKNYNFRHFRLKL